MKLKTIIAAAFTAVITSAGANAAPLNLTSMLNFNQNGMSSSLVHQQSDPSDMSGTTLAFFDSFLDGMYDVASGLISFKGTYAGGSDYTAEGNLSLSGRPNGVFGSIKFNFGASAIGALAGQSITFNFLDQTFNDDANKFGSGNVGGPYEGRNFVGLWGSSCRAKDDIPTIQSLSAEICYGIDLRIEHDGDPDGGSIPLPASAFLLLAGIGGLGVSRKLRKKA